MTKIKNICVFCGARENVADKYKKFAYECGKMIGENGYNLVYGGNIGGLMGIVSDATQEFGGKSIGVFSPVVLKTETINPNLDETIIVDSMQDRKQQMMDKSDIFLIIPGGFGTLDEFFEVLTLKNIDYINKPIIVVNFDNYWYSLIQLMDHIFETGFAVKNMKNNYLVLNTLQETLEYLKKDQ